MGKGFPIIFAWSKELLGNKILEAYFRYNRKKSSESDHKLFHRKFAKTPPLKFGN